MGRSGRQALGDHLPRLRERLNLDFVVVNAENAAHGFGTVSYTHLTLPTIYSV